FETTLHLPGQIRGGTESTDIALGVKRDRFVDMNFATRTDDRIDPVDFAKRANRLEPGAANMEIRAHVIVTGPGIERKICRPTIDHAESKESFGERRLQADVGLLEKKSP